MAMINMLHLLMQRMLLEQSTGMAVHLLVTQVKLGCSSVFWEHYSSLCYSLFVLLFYSVVLSFESAYVFIDLILKITQPRR